MEFSKYRGFKGATQCFNSGIVDDVFCCSNHIALLLHQHMALVVLDRMLVEDDSELRFLKQSQAEFEAAEASHVLYRSFSSTIVSVVFGVVCGALRLVVACDDGAVYWFEWSNANKWSSSFVSQVLDKQHKESLLLSVRLEANTLICVEKSTVRPNESLITKRDCFKDRILGPPVTVCRVVSDSKSVRLFVTKTMHGWVLSDHGGLTCVNLREVMGTPFPPNFVERVVFCQHPLTRELTMLSLETHQLFLLKPFSDPVLLCQLEEKKPLSQCVGICFVYQWLFVLDEGGSRSSLYDAGTGKLLKAVQSPLHSKLATQSGFGASGAIIWGHSLGMMAPFQNESIAKLQASLPMARAFKIAQDWNLSRANDIALLAEDNLQYHSEEAASLLMQNTASPALSVAVVGGVDQDPVLKRVEQTKDMEPQACFQRFSMLSSTVNPLLEKWGKGRIENEYESNVSEEELFELLALERPEKALDDLFLLYEKEKKKGEEIEVQVEGEEGEKQGQENEWQFRLICRLLFKLRPHELVEFVGNTKVEQVLHCLPLGLKMTREQCVACAKMLENTGRRAAANRVLQGNGVDDEMIDFRLSFANAVSKKDSEGLAKLWETSDLDTTSLLKMFSVYGDFEEQENGENMFDQGLTVAVLLQMVERQKKAQPKEK